MPNTVIYPFDPTGLAATNLVTDEQHTLTSVNSTTYRLIIPKFAPFHVNNFEMVHITMDGVETPLQEAIDFNFVFLYLGASRSIGTVVYGGITLLNELTDGYIKIKRYQTLGGEWCCDQQYVLSLLADIVFNPRTIPWEKLTNVQQVFPPINHDQAMDWIKGHDDLIQAVNSLADTIVNGGQLREQNLSLLIRNMVMTAVQVGLGDVQNLPLATMAEVNASLPVNKYITLAQAISLVNNQIDRLNQAGGAITTQNISDFTQATTQIITSYLTQNPPTVSASGVNGLSQFVAQAITQALTTAIGPINQVNNDQQLQIDDLISGLNILQDALGSLNTNFQQHNHDARTLNNLADAVFGVMGALFDTGVWVNKGGVAQIGVPGEDYPGLATANNWGRTQIPARNEFIDVPVANAVEWDIKLLQVYRLNLNSNVNSLTILGMDQFTLGADVKMVVLNNGGNITWPANVRFGDGVVPNLTLTPGKYDILTFTVESTDGVNYFLLNTGFKGNL